MDLQARIRAWDAAFAAVRGYFRAQGLAEVSTPVRLPAVAVEPYIEPLDGGGGVLATSPELPMKRLLAGGAGPIFQVAHVFRASERGAQHAEEFHLIEWYRPGAEAAAAGLPQLQRDVEGVIADVFAAVGQRDPPATWRCEGMLDLVARTTGVTLRGDEDAAALSAAVTPTRPDLAPRGPGIDAARPDVAALAAWTSFFSSWSDADLDPWLSRQRSGVHVVEFPPALAALSRLGPPTVTQTAAPIVAARVESHCDGVELANGYGELTAVVQQTQRFATVQGLRAQLGQAPLPPPEAFLSMMRDPGLPPAIGCALGLDRLLALACGVTTLAEVALPLSWSNP